MDFSEIYANIDILAAQLTQALYVTILLPHTLKITQINIMFKSFSNLIPIWQNLPPKLNKGFIGPPCSTCERFFHLTIPLDGYTKFISSRFACAAFVECGLKR